MTKKAATKTNKPSAPIKALMVVFGPKSVGKTTLAATAGPTPSKVLLLDGDTGKTRYVAEEMGIQYINLSKEGREMTEIEYFEMFIKNIDAVKDDSLDVMIIDNPGRFFLGAHSYVLDNVNKFRKHWSHMGPIKGAQQWQIVKKVLLPEIYTKMMDKATLVIFCAHEKPHRDETQALTGFMQYDADETLLIAAGMAVRLTRNFREPSAAPVGLLVKPPMYVPSNDGTITTVFPERIAPMTWDQIRYYVANPVGKNDALKDTEVPDQDEHNLITGSLNEEQKKVQALNRALLELRLEESMQDDIQQAFTRSDVTKQPKDNMRFMVVEQLLKDTYPGINKGIIESVYKKMKQVA